MIGIDRSIVRRVRVHIERDRRLIRRFGVFDFTSAPRPDRDPPASDRKIAANMAGCCEQASAIDAGRGIEQFRFRELRPWAPLRGNPITDFSCKML